MRSAPAAPSSLQAFYSGRSAARPTPDDPRYGGTVVVAGGGVALAVTLVVDTPAPISIGSGLILLGLLCLSLIALISTVLLCSRIITSGKSKNNNNGNRQQFE